MKFTNCRPTLTPTLSDQRDALQKGLGRAFLWAKAGVLDEQLLLEACLKDQRYDQQFENPRGDWLWELINIIDAKNRFRLPILDALQEEKDGWNASQLSDFALNYAALGEEIFRDTLYGLVEHKPFDDNISLGEKAIMQLDGEQGFLFSAHVRGHRLATDEWKWDDDYFVSNAIEVLGEEEIVRLWKTSTDTDINRFYLAWKEGKQNQSSADGNGSYIERMQAIPVENIIEAAHSNGNCSSFAGWGRHTDAASLNAILEMLWQTTELTVLQKLIRVFGKQTMPEFDLRLIDLCKHPDEELQRRSFTALANHSHPAIRSYALDQLTVNATANIISLFINNYEVGDEERILSAISLPEDTEELHWLLYIVLNVLETNQEANTSRLAHITYDANPCEICRFKAIRLLKNQSVAPMWMMEECRYDSYEESRKFAEPNTEQ